MSRSSTQLLPKISKHIKVVEAELKLGLEGLARVVCAGVFEAGHKSAGASAADE